MGTSTVPGCPALGLTNAHRRISVCMDPQNHQKLNAGGNGNSVSGRWRLPGNRIFP